MDHIRFHRLAKAIRREAAARGYHGDVYAEADSVPLVGTINEQMDIATILVDVSPGPMSTRDRALLNRLVRAAVLTSPVRPVSMRIENNGRPAVSGRMDNNAKLARARRRSA